MSEMDIQPFCISPTAYNNGNLSVVGEGLVPSFPFHARAIIVDDLLATEFVWG
jgi:hypothetical protein